MTVLFLPQPYATLATIKQTCICEDQGNNVNFPHDCVKDSPILHCIPREMPASRRDFDDPIIVAATSTLIDIDQLYKLTTLLATVHPGAKFMNWPDAWMDVPTWL